MSCILDGENRIQDVSPGSVLSIGILVATATSILGASGNMSKAGQAASAVYTSNFLF